ncbi:MAG: hypothetical protein ACO378_01155 [Sedimenticolaceae bacterium]|jgi:hypothetical protein
MSIPFSELPGRHERHYKRRLDNPLFREPATLNDADLLNAQRLDHEELLAFITELRATVERALNLKSNEESDVILKLKEDLERLYETSAGLADEQGANQQALSQLLAAVMNTIRSNTTGDSLAEQEMAMEQQARQMHFELLQHALVADLLHPETLIAPDQLVPTLLSSPTEQVKAVMVIFDPEQLAMISQEAQALLSLHDPQKKIVDAQTNLTVIQQAS